MRWLWGVVVLELVVGAVAVAVIEPEADEPARFGAAGSTTVPAGAGSTAGPEGPSTTAKAAKPTGRTATTATTATTQPAGQTLKPAKAGEYNFRKRFTGENGSFESTGTYTLNAAREDEGEIRQT